MKRAETYWQMAVLLLVLLMTVSIYGVLGWLLTYVRGGGHDPESARALPVDAVVRIIEPLDGAVLQRSGVFAVRAVAVQPGFVEAELRVDGRTAAIQVNPEPGAAPWMVQWIWEDAAEGAHSLAVGMRRSRGEVETSPVVTVTVVPSGTLVFASKREGAYAIYSMQSDGSDVTRLTGGPGDARQPAPRKDGWLAFATRTESGQSMIRQVDTEGGEEKDLFRGSDPAWAPDGSQLAFSSSSGGVSQVYVAPVMGGAANQVTSEETYGGQPAWSPDGTRLVYVAERDGDMDIWAVAADGLGASRLTDEPAMDWAPSWSPDGSQVAFVSDRGGSHQIYVMRADGSKVRMLTSLVQGAEGPAWSPDGYWLAFVAYTGDGSGVSAREIYLMRADGQNQVRLTYNDVDDTDVDWLRKP